MQIFVCFFVLKLLKKLVAFFNFFFQVVILSPEWILVELIFLQSNFNDFFIDSLFRQPNSVRKKKIKKKIFEKNSKFLPKTCTDQKWDQIGDQDCQENFFAGHEISLFVVVWRQCWIFWVIWTTNFTRRRRFSTPDCSKCPFSKK